jgi:hypothetical protein
MCEVLSSEVILGSEITCISIVRPPGEVDLVSCKNLLAILASAKRLPMAFGMGPWTAMKKWSSAASKLKDSDVAIVLDDTSMDRAGYITEEKDGTFLDLWPECEHSPLFGTLLGLVGEAWQVGPSELTKQERWHQTRPSLFGEFRRPD